MPFSKKIIVTIAVSLSMLVVNHSIAIEGRAEYEIVNKIDDKIEYYKNFSGASSVYKFAGMPNYTIYTFDDGCFKKDKCYTIIIVNDLEKETIVEGFFYTNWINYGEVKSFSDTIFEVVSFSNDIEKFQIVLLGNGRAIVYGE